MNTRVLSALFLALALTAGVSFVGCAKKPATEPAAGVETEEGLGKMMDETSEDMSTAGGEATEAPAAAPAEGAAAPAEGAAAPAEGAAPAADAHADHH